MAMNLQVKKGATDIFAKLQPKSNVFELQIQSTSHIVFVTLSSIKFTNIFISQLHVSRNTICLFLQNHSNYTSPNLLFNTIEKCK